MENVSKNVPELGDRLGIMRTKRNISQSDLANTINMSRPNYTAIENKVPGRFLKDYQLKILADKLDVSADYLLGRIPDSNPKTDLIGIETALQISSNTVHKINEIYKNSTTFSKFNLFENFMQYFEIDFWETVGLYKRANSFYKSEYQFVLTFTSDFYPTIIDFNHLNKNCDNLDYEYKYYYIDRNIVKDLHQKHYAIFSDESLSLNEKFDKISELVHKGSFSEYYAFPYSDSKRKQELVLALNKVKKILHDFSFIMDFDESSIIFSLWDKQVEICKYIDKLLDKINKIPVEPIDNEIKNTWSSLEFFNKSVTSSLDFIKYKINDYLNKYLEEDY